MGGGAGADEGGGRTPGAASGFLLVKRGPRALVTDAEHRSVLAACRGLAAAGYRVSTVAGERFALGHWSRFSKERITLAGPEADPEGYVEHLSRILRRDEYDLVLPGTELSLIPISERRDQIEPYARLGLPPHEIVLRALDKPVLQSQAAAVGLAPPRSVVCSNAEEALAAAPDLRFPVLVKPASSVTWKDGRIKQQEAQVVKDISLLEGAVAAVAEPITLQEYISGTSMVSCAAVRIDGRLHGLTLARYVRRFPSQIGRAALATTITPPRPLIRQVEELLGLIGWSGIFELELLELGENRFGAIDLNPRPFGWMALAIGAGANLPALWCDHVLQRHSISSSGARTGVHYRWEDGDFRNALEQLSLGRLGTAAAVLRPHRRVVHAHFQIDDPMPLAARMLSIAQKARRRIARGGARARTAVPASSLRGRV